MFYLRQLKKLNLPKTMMVVFYTAITRVHPHLLHHHLVRCNYSQGEGQLQRVISYAERVIGCNLPSLHDLHAFRTLRRADWVQLFPPWTQTVRTTPLLQETALHQDQNLSPPEQFLPLCYRTQKQGPGPPLTLSHIIDSMHSMQTISCSF